VIIDVRKVMISEKGNRVIIDNVGWTICPVFSPNEYVKSGIYQLPIFKGAVPIYIVEGLQRRDPWEYIEERLADKKGGI